MSGFTRVLRLIQTCWSLPRPLENTHNSRCLRDRGSGSGEWAMKLFGPKPRGMMYRKKGGLGIFPRMTGLDKGVDLFP